MAMPAAANPEEPYVEQPEEPMATPVRRKFGITAVVIVLTMVCGLAEVVRRYGLRETRPVCEEGEDPMIRDCLPAPKKVDWKSPTFAVVRPNETLVEIRWFKGKLFHPIGRFFGGHHSALVGVFSSGNHVRVEKFGASSVQYCPTIGGGNCNLFPGELYKRAGGKFLKNITWAGLHAAMMEDHDHYDVIDANCHHAVQHGWNAVVVPQAMDRTLGPDTSVVKRWEGLLRRFVAVEDESPDEEVAPAPVQARALSTNGTNDTDSDFGNLPSWLPESRRNEFEGDHFTTNGYPIQSFDGPTVRRRRRRQMIAQRCRGSSLEGENNCPQRRSCMFEESSSGGGRSCFKEFECSSKYRCQCSWFMKLWKDKDFTGCKSQGQSDCKFQRTLSCGGENDISGSIHWRSQSCRPSSQSASFEDSSVEMMPMDPARVEGNSKNADGSSIWASECSHSQADRSKGEGEGACNTDLTGVQKDTGSDFLCQWKCASGDVTFMTSSVSTYVCTDDVEFNISVGRGQTESDCVDACAEGGCQDDCVGKCRQVASAALDAGQAVCMSGTDVTTTGYGWEPLEQRGLSPGVIVGIILFFCCQCCCNLCAMKSKGGGGDSGGASRFG